MSCEEPATAAFIRYLRQEVNALSIPIEAGCQHMGDWEGNSPSEIIRAALRSVAGYFVRMSGAMTPPTDSFWRGLAEYFESQLGTFPEREQDREFFDKIQKSSRPSELFGSGAVDFRMLHAIGFYDRQNDSAYLPRAKMFLWRFAEAFVAADLEGTIDEEAALEGFKKLLDVETTPESGNQEGSGT